MASMRMVVPVLCSTLLAASTACFAEEPAPRSTVECPTKIKKAERATGKVVDLNTATVKQISEIPWVGKKTARAIVDRRKTVGEFKSMEQLTLINGVGDKVYACLVMYATVEAKAKTTTGTSKVP